MIYHIGDHVEAKYIVNEAGHLNGIHGVITREYKHQTKPDDIAWFIKPDPSDHPHFQTGEMWFHESELRPYGYVRMGLSK